MAEETEVLRYPALHDPSGVLEYARRVADEVHDTCGLTSGVRIGLNEMGLLRRVEAEPDGDGSCWSVRLLLRLTSRGCNYYFMFKDVLEERLAAHPQVSRAVVDWDPSLDWTPEYISPAARLRLEERRRAMRPPEWGNGAGVVHARPPGGTEQ